METPGTEPCSPVDAGKAAHIALLSAVRHEFKFEGLKTLHGAFDSTEFIQKARPASPSALFILAMNGEYFHSHR